MIKDYEISIRSRGGYGKSAKHEWTVYGPDGGEVASGESLGAYGNAQVAAQEAQNLHYMNTRREN